MELDSRHMVTKLDDLVVLTILPDHIYWLVLQCTWNAFTVQNMGVSDSHLYTHQQYFG